MPVTYLCDRCGAITRTESNGSPVHGTLFNFFADGQNRFVCEKCTEEFIKFRDHWWNMPSETRSAKFIEIGFEDPGTPTYSGEDPF